MFCSDAICNGLKAKVQGLPVGVRLFPTLAPARLDGTTEIRYRKHLINLDGRFKTAIISKLWEDVCV